MILCNAAPAEPAADQSAKQVEDEVTGNPLEDDQQPQQPEPAGAEMTQDPQPEKTTDGEIVPVSAAPEVAPVTVVETAVVPSVEVAEQSNAGGGAVVYQNVIFQGDPAQIGPFFPQYGVPGLPTIHSADYQSFSTCTLPVVQATGDLTG